MKTRALLSRISKALLENPALPILAKLYLDLAKAWYKGAAGEMRDTGHAVFVSFPYNSLGDVLALVPLLESIHTLWPAARIDVALGDAVANLLDTIPFVRVVPVRAVPHSGLIQWRLREIGQLVRCYRQELAKYRYDLSISPRWGSDSYARASRYLMYLAPSRRYISYSATVDGGPATLDWLSTNVATGGEMDPESLRQLKLLQRVGLVPPGGNFEASIRSQTQSLVAIAENMSRMDVNKFIEGVAGRQFNEFIVVSPGSTRASNRWPIERFVEIVLHLHKKFGLPTLAVGASADAASCESLSREAPGVIFSLGGKTTLLELAALIRRARLFIGSDSGPAHMAGALGVCTVVLTSFARSSDQAHRLSAVRWRPNGPCVSQVGPRQPFPPCESGCDMDRPHCILQVEPGEVFAAAAKFLDGRNQSQPL